MELHNFNSMIDLYGFKPHLFINGYNKKGTIIGIIFSFITWIFMITITVYYCNKLFISKELHTLSSVRSATSSDTVSINKDNFFFAFALEDPRYNVYVDEEVYYPEVFYKHGVRNAKGQFDYSDSIKLITEKCSEEYFGDKFQDLITSFPLDNMYCIKNLNHTLTGSFAADEYSFIVLNMYPCKNTNETKCKSQDLLDYYLDGAFFTFQYQNFIFDPNDFDEPFKPKIGDYMTTISKKYFKNIYIYLKKHLLTTDTGLIFENKEETHMTLYDYGSDLLSFQTSKNFMQLTFRMSLDVDEVSRSYTKAQTIISYIGGFITFLQTIFALLTELLMNNFIYEKIINKIFFFKKDDETIVQNNLKKKYNLSTFMYSQNNISFKKDITNNNDISYSNNNSINDKSASIHLNNNNDDTNILKYNRSSKHFISNEIFKNNSDKANSILKLQKNNNSNIEQDKTKNKIVNIMKTKTLSANNKSKNENVNNFANIKANFVSNNENNNNYKNILMTNFLNKGKQKKRKKLYNSYFKRLFYTCFKKDPKINLYYKGITIIKQKLDIISIIKDSFNIELIKKFFFGKEHIILLNNFIKNELMEIKVEKYKFDIDKDIIVDDNIINSFEFILNRNVNNNYKKEEYFNKNYLNKVDKFFIEAVVRQNKY